MQIKFLKTDDEDKDKNVEKYKKDRELSLIYVMKSVVEDTDVQSYKLAKLLEYTITNE
jgi:hypothetical protein